MFVFSEQPHTRSMIVCPGTGLRVKRKADKVNFKHVIGIYMSGAAPTGIALHGGMGAWNGGAKI